MTPAGTTATVRPASNTTPIEMGLPAEIQPQATTLRDALAPSHRMIAAKGLAEGRHGSSEAVKAVLFHAAKTDPCPAVKACCIEHLCSLGYFDPAFLKHLKMASDDASSHRRVSCCKSQSEPCGRATADKDWFGQREEFADALQSRRSHFNPRAHPSRRPCKHDAPSPLAEVSALSKHRSSYRGMTIMHKDHVSV